MSLVSRAPNHDNRPLWPDFRPFTLSSEALFVQHFPGLEYERIIAAFVNHYVPRGKTSRNWDMEFHNFCDHRFRQMQEQERAAYIQSGTDTMGRPLDPEARRLYEMHVEQPKYAPGDVFLALALRIRKESGVDRSESLRLARERFDSLSADDVESLMNENEEQSQ